MSDRASAGFVPRIWAAVPFRGPAGSKRRLAGLLDESERAKLSLAMLDDVLDVLLGSPGVERVLLLTPSRTDGSWRDDGRLTVVEEHRTTNGSTDVRGLNAALRQAQRMAQAGGADGLLIVPADLPLIDASDLEAVLDAGRSAAVVIVPDRVGHGTNALLLAPPMALEPSFGEGSYARHRHLSDAAGLSLAVVERSSFGLDLDTPADVVILLASPAASRATSLLRELGVEGRLDRFLPAQARSTTI